MQAAIYIGNRTPTWTNIDGVNTWTTPFERTINKKPNLANLRVFGCRAYVRNPKVAKGNKMTSRAWIGYMVGYVASNIWKIWNPRRREVVEERDVVFDETRFYDPDLPLPEDLPIELPPEIVQTVHLPPAIQEVDEEPVPEVDEPPESLMESSIESTDHQDANSSSIEQKDPAPVTPDRSPAQTSLNSGQVNPVIEDQYTQMPGAFENPDSPIAHQDTEMDLFMLPSPEETAHSSASDTEVNDPVTSQLSQELDQSTPQSESRGSATPAGGESVQSAQLSQQAEECQLNTADRAAEISADLNPDFIVTGKRKCRPAHNAFSAYQGFSIGWSKPFKTPTEYTESTASQKGCLH